MAHLLKKMQGIRSTGRYYWYYKDTGITLNLGH